MGLHPPCKPIYNNFLFTFNYSLTLCYFYVLCFNLYCKSCVKQKHKLTKVKQRNLKFCYKDCSVYLLYYERIS